MTKPTIHHFNVGLWSLGVVVSALATGAWSATRLSGGNELTPYSFFPVLGLLAFSLMWTHYIGGTLRAYWGLPKSSTQTYFTYTGWAVLLLILSHPGIFWIALYSDGLGLPPVSYLSVYTDSILRIALLLGTFSLASFLVFELHRTFSRTAWWKYVEYANIAAMFAIFYHALTLGGELGVSWYRYTWYFYGLTLAVAISYSYSHRHKEDGYEK
jgi:hypothetical protein